VRSPNQPSNHDPTAPNHHNQLCWPITTTLVNLESSTSLDDYSGIYTIFKFGANFLITFSPIQTLFPFLFKKKLF